MSGSVTRMVSTPAFKFIILGVLTLALMIPLLLVFLIVGERESYSRAATAEVGRKWGRAQTFTGPYLLVPIERENERVDRNGVKTKYLSTNYVTILPEKVDVKADVETDELKRGIYSIPVYTSKVAYNGKFKKSDFENLRQDNYNVRLDRAVLAMQITDVRGIKKTTSMALSPFTDNGITVGDSTVKFRAGVGVYGQRGEGIHVKIDKSLVTSGFAFKFEIPLKGTDYLQIEPSGGETNMTMTSNWPHPSFIGNFLPDDRTISKSGFEAKWHVPQLARGSGQVHVRAGVGPLMPKNKFGVKLYQPIGFYDLVGRALKYAVAFISVVFLLVYIMEVYVGRPVHWIQYVFVGFALLIFYLVLLGLAEHVGFEIAYGTASLATASLIGLYCWSTLNSASKGLFLGTLIALFYGLLYLLLRVEDYALLIGSLSGFVMLAGVMYLTRNVDWSGYKVSSPEDDTP